METDCPTLSVPEALAELDRVAPGVPLLALGQTVFWDEPMKAGIVRGLEAAKSTRRFVAGIHDTDYFAKSPGSERKPGRFRALAHNDTTTKGLWSAAGEFSALFGSETVITKETLAQAGLRTDALERERPGFLDHATEAWGWRGVASLDEHPPITAHVPLRQVWPELKSTLDWAINTSLEGLSDEGKREAESSAEHLRSMLCEARESDATTLSDCYRQLTKCVYDFCAGEELDFEVTATTELLNFNSSTASLPRFSLVNAFIDPASRGKACRGYDEAVRGSGLYELVKFGTGAIPFDLVIPGRGRGTLRLGPRGAVIETPEPVFLSFKKPPMNAEELAAIVEAKFGPGCALIGKAVTLIGMLAAEFVFVLHEGGSGYVSLSRRLLTTLGDVGLAPPCHPILRVRYETWDSLQTACAWLALPEPLRRPFGTEDVCAPSFARRWREVAVEQSKALAKLGELRKPIDLIRYLDQSLGGSWKALASEYEELHRRLVEVERDVAGIREERHSTVRHLKLLKQIRAQAERAKGEHFRRAIFEKQPSASDIEERGFLAAGVEAAIDNIASTQATIKDLVSKQDARVKDQAVRQAFARRRDLEVEAELARLRMIREAVIASRGLHKANRRPSAWWFPLVSPDGLWFRETTESARCYLEPLSS